jgi:site-specific recombinase XerD
LETFGYRVEDEFFVLNNIKGIYIAKQALQKFFKTMLKKADLSEHYHIHCLRHTYATFLLKASHYNYRFVQEQLGHASIKTTQVYAVVIESDGKKAPEKNSQKPCFLLVRPARFERAAYGFEDKNF